MPRMKRTKARTKRINMDLLSRFDTEDKKNYGLSTDYQITYAVMKDRLKNPLRPIKSTDVPKRTPLPVWEDRNRANQNTKLNY